MRNIYFYETREEAKAKAKELKKKKCRSVIITKEPKPYKTDDGRLFYYSVMWVFWYKTKNLKKIKILFDKDSELGYYIIKIKGIRR